MSDTIPCPRCGATAESTKRFWLDSTDGPIQRPKIGCLSKHWFTPRPETVQREQVATRSATRRRYQADRPGTAGGLGEQAGSLVAEQDGWEVMPMCLRCGVVDYPYRSWPSGPAGPGDYGFPPEASPPEYGATPTGGFIGIGATGRDYRMTTGRWDRGRGIGGNILTKLHVIR